MVGPDGLVLTEVAPGIQIDRDIRPHVGFDLVLAAQVKTMDERIFAREPMGLWRSFGGEGDAASEFVRQEGIVGHAQRASSVGRNNLGTI